MLLVNRKFKHLDLNILIWIYMFANYREQSFNLWERKLDFTINQTSNISSHKNSQFIL